MADRPITDIDEGSRGGTRSVALFAVVAAVVLVFLVVVGSRGGHVVPNTPAPTAPAGSANP